jgi:hypothetical protein
MMRNFVKFFRVILPLAALFAVFPAIFWIPVAITAIVLERNRVMARATQTLEQNTSQSLQAKNEDKKTL